MLFKIYMLLVFVYVSALNFSRACLMYEWIRCDLTLSLLFENPLIKNQHFYLQLEIQINIYTKLLKI